MPAFTDLGLVWKKIKKINLYNKSYTNLKQRV